MNRLRQPILGFKPVRIRGESAHVAALMSLPAPSMDTSKSLVAHAPCHRRSKVIRQRHASWVSAARTHRLDANRLCKHSGATRPHARMHASLPAFAPGICSWRLDAHRSTACLQVLVWAGEGLHGRLLESMAAGARVKALSAGLCQHVAQGTPCASRHAAAHRGCACV